MPRQTTEDLEGVFDSGKELDDDNDKDVDDNDDKDDNDDEDADPVWEGVREGIEEIYPTSGF